MPVDLEKDVRRLSETGERVPGLSEACELALGIVEAAQLCVRNKLKLQSLAHSTTDYLISIAKCLHGSSEACNPVSNKLLGLLNQLKRVLQEVSTAIQKYSRLSLEASIWAATERDKDINKLEERLKEVQGSIFSLHGYSDIFAGNKPPSEKFVNYHIGLTVHRPQSVGNSQYRSGLHIKRPATTMVPQRSKCATRPLQHEDLKGYPFSPFGLEQDITRLHDAPETALSDHSFEFSDNISRVESLRIGVPDRPPSRTFLSRLKRRPAPDLTESIKNIRHTSFCGGDGDIYSGVLTNSRGSERVALKLLRVVNQKAQIEKAQKKFRREVNIWCSLRHRNVLSFYGTSRCESDETRLFMVSPWAENGKSLDYLQRNPNANRGVLLHQTSSALEYLHSGKDVPPIVHGDVKADNVLISQTGEALLCDFGLSHFAEGCISSDSSDANGTVRFMAPELLINRDSIPASKPTKESDVYAFGSLMIQIYTGRLPFSDVPNISAILKVANKEVPTRPTDPVVIKRGLDDHIWALMIDCWNADPSHRPSIVEVTWKLLWAVAVR